MAIEILEKLHDNGELRELIHSGLVSVNVLLWYKVYKSYHFQIDNGVKKGQAITDVSDTFAISERAVYLILKKFKQ